MTQHKHGQECRLSQKSNDWKKGKINGNREMKVYYRVTIITNHLMLFNLPQRH